MLGTIPYAGEAASTNATLSTDATATPVDEQTATLLAALACPGKRSLPEFTLYNDLGSALFHARTLLPEYDVFRVENTLLEDKVPHLLAWAQDRAPRYSTAAFDQALTPEQRHTPPARCSIADLGCGSGLKTRVVVKAISASMPIAFFPIDISSEALRQCKMAMADVNGVRVMPFQGSFLPGLEHVQQVRQIDTPLLALLLGSTISQFDIDDIVPFFQEIRARMLPGDALVVGADGIRSPEEMILQYDDVLGIEAALDKNALNFVNHALDGDFDIAAFDYAVSTRPLDAIAPLALAVVERALVARTTQYVSLRKAQATLVIAEGEQLKLVHSLKFGPGSIAALGRAAGFSVLADWRDARTGFSDTFLQCPLEPLPEHYETQ